MAELPVVFTDVLERADATLLAGWYHAVSVNPDRIRAWLRFRGLPFVDPAKPEPPPLEDVDRTAEIVIGRSSNLLGALGGAAGFAGAATVPPEWVATAIAVLRLGQRLCVIYGFDPGTDRGEMALSRALAGAYGVAIPDAGPLRMRVRDLVTLLRPDAPDPDDVTAGTAAPRRGIGSRIARAMAKNTAWWVAGRLSRFVPVLSASSHAVETRGQVTETGRKMSAVLRQLAEVYPAAQGPVEEAHELVGRDRTA